MRETVLSDAVERLRSLLERYQPAAVAMRFLPLLLGRIEIADIVLDHPHIAVKIDKTGRSNWSPLLTSLASALKPADRTRAQDEVTALLDPILRDETGLWIADYVRLRFRATAS